MGIRFAGLALLAAMMLASCSFASRVLVINDSGAPFKLFSGGEPRVSNPLDTIVDQKVIGFAGSARWTVRRGDCLYGYLVNAQGGSEANDAFRALGMKPNVSTPFAVVRFDAELTAHLFGYDEATKTVTGPELTVAGFPLKPETTCESAG